MQAHPSEGSTSSQDGSSSSKPASSGFELPSDELMLAALVRAILHKGRDRNVLLHSIAEHLGLPWSSATARRILPLLRRLHEEGLVVSTKRHSSVHWSLSSKGKQLLSDKHKAGQVPQLPESPQHKAWREALTACELHMERFSSELRSELEHGIAMLEDAKLGEQEVPSSDEWYEAGRRLHKLCQRQASATYCRYEWAEPSDDKADVDDYTEPDDAELSSEEQDRLRFLRRGRRSTWQWGWEEE